MKYKELKKKKKYVKQLINKSKSEYHNKKLEDDRRNSGAVWKTLKQLLSNNKSTICPLLLEDERKINYEINRFNRYVVGRETFDKSRQNLENHDNESQLIDIINPTCDMFRPQTTDSQTIRLVLKQLKNSSSHT